MNSTLQIVIAGRDRDFIDQVAPIVQERFGCKPVLQHIINGHADPLHGYVTTPDLLVLDLAADWREQLGAICNRPAAARPTMLVVGPGTEVNAMRLAMRAGASDYLSTPLNKAEFLLALSHIEQEEREQGRGACRWTSVIGAKGGVGTSMLACNLAQLICEHDKRTALLDLHLQTGSLANYLDLTPRNNFRDAIEAIQDLDSIALDGFMTKTKQGLHLLAAPIDQILLSDQIQSNSLTMLLELISNNYEHVIVDLPRNIDNVVATTIEQSDQLFLVMEQSVVALRETLRTLDVLCREFAFSESQIRIVINRLSKNAEVTEKHIRKSLGDFDLYVIPNDYRSVRESLDIGIPLVSHARHSPAAKAMAILSAEITGIEPERGSFVQSLTSILRN